MVAVPYFLALGGVISLNLMGTVVVVVFGFGTDSFMTCWVTRAAILREEALRGLGERGMSAEGAASDWILLVWLLSLAVLSIVTNLTGCFGCGAAAGVVTFPESCLLRAGLGEGDLDRAEALLGKTMPEAPLSLSYPLSLGAPNTRLDGTSNLFARCMSGVDGQEETSGLLTVSEGPRSIIFLLESMGDDGGVLGW